MTAGCAKTHFAPTENPQLGGDKHYNNKKYYLYERGANPLCNSSVFALIIMVSSGSKMFTGWSQFP